MSNFYESDWFLNFLIILLFSQLKDGKKVNECLRKCLKIAAQCVDTNAQFELHVEILNYYMYYFEAKNDQVNCQIHNTVNLDSGFVTQQFS